VTTGGSLSPLRKKEEFLDFKPLNTKIEYKNG